MMLKGTVAVLLALVFQLAQSPIAAAFQDGCHDGPPAHCACCVNHASCPCAADGDDPIERPLTPVLPETPKVPAVKLVETKVLPETDPVPEPQSQVPAAPVNDPIAGYCGVRFAVAFCSYLM